MRNTKVIFIGLFLFTVQLILAQKGDDLVLGSKFEINSQVLNETRSCLISLPDSYKGAADVQREYPVIILLDGGTHFKMTAGIVDFLGGGRNRNYYMPEAIVVAIENVDRERDFTHTKIKTKRINTMGGGRNFLEFIEKELIPYVDANYHTAPNRLLIGHSLGGLLTLNAYMDENSIFDGFVAIDPSIWWDDALMKEKVDGISARSFEKKLFIATAARDSEAGQARNKKRHDSFYKLLSEKMIDNSNARIAYFEDESHRSVPLIALYKGLTFVYEEE